MKICFTKYLSFIFIAFIIYLLNGCANPRPTIYYTINLKDITSVGNQSDSYKKYDSESVISLEDRGVNGFGFKDDKVKFVWAKNISGGIEFVVVNQTQRSIKLLWDEIVFRDTTGSSNRMIHKATVLTKKDDPQIPSMIASNSFLYDILLPVDKVSYNIFLKEWESSPMLGDDRFIVNKSFQIVMPLEIEDIKTEYTFNFVVIDAKVINATTVQTPTEYTPKNNTEALSSDAIVYKNPGEHTYHRENCPKRKSNATSMKKASAEKRGLKPCDSCNP